MIELELTDDQATTLTETLDVVLSNLSVEIADTDRQSYRDGLKARRDQLAAIRASLPG